jgi:hypothetical protein
MPATVPSFQDHFMSERLPVSQRPSLGEYGPATPGPLVAIPQGWKRALMRHQAENVTQEYGWQESERILGDADRGALSTVLARGRGRR